MMKKKSKIPMMIIFLIVAIILWSFVRVEKGIVEEPVKYYVVSNYGMADTITNELMGEQIQMHNSGIEVVLEEEVALVEVPNEDTEEVVNEGDELYWLSRIISAEAKGECAEGQIAVGNVVLNRVDANGFPNNIKEVIFQKGQFCPVNSGSIYTNPTNSAVESAKKVLDGRRVVSNEALYFYNPQVVSRDSWIRSRPTDKDIGNHRFAK